MKIKEIIEELDNLRAGDVFRAYGKPDQIIIPQTGRLSPLTFPGDLPNVNRCLELNFMRKVFLALPDDQNRDLIFQINTFGERLKKTFNLYDYQIPDSFEFSYAFSLYWEDKYGIYRNLLLCAPSIPLLVMNDQVVPMAFNFDLRKNKQDILQKIKEVKSSIFQKESEKCDFDKSELTFF